MFKSYLFLFDKSIYKSSCQIEVVASLIIGKSITPYN